MAGSFVRAVHSLRGHLDTIWSVAYAANGALLVSCSEDRAVIVWDLETYQERFSFVGHFSGVNCVACAPCGFQIATGGEDGTVRLWHLGRRRGFSLRRHAGAVNQVAFSPDGRLLAAVGGIYGRLGQVKIWDVATRKLVTTLDGHPDEVMTVAFSPSGRLLATGDFLGTLKVWDMARGTECFSVTAHAGVIWKTAFVEEDRVLYSAGEDGQVRFWLTPTGRPLSSLPSPCFGILSAAYGGQTRLAVGHFDGELALWTLDRSRKPQPLGNHGAPVYAVAVAPDGRSIASAGADHTIRLWRLALRRPVAAMAATETPPAELALLHA